MTDAAKSQLSDVTFAPKQWSRVSWLQLTGVVAATLLIPAMFNRFPLIFSDTPAYLSVAFGQSWTVDRSGFYGLAFKPILSSVEPMFGLWLVVALQAILVATALLLVVRRISPEASPGTALVVILPIALLTSLPWHAGQLMPDSMTGVLILLVWLAASRDLRAPGSALLWLGAGFLSLVHYTHIGLLIVAAAVTVSAAALSGSAWREIAERVAAAALVLALVMSSHVAANATTFGRWSVAPMSSLFLFARLNEDGLAPRWLDRHCGHDAPAELCNIRSEIPRDSQILLWGGPKSPLTPHIHTRIGQAESWRWIDMLGQAASGSIRDEPLTFLGFSAKSGVTQLAHFKALDDECPDVCAMGAIDLVGYRPQLKAPLENARQLRGEIRKPPIQLLTSAVAVAGQILLLPLLAVAIRRRDSAAICLLAVVAVALAANALMTGALSDVHDRYQSRLVWLAPFIVLLLASRWRWLTGRGAVRLR